jgi:hypothetical protein
MSFAGSASAQVITWEVTATNNSGAVRTDLHVGFTGTGGSISNAKVITNIENGPATISVVSGADVVIDWTGAGIPVGNSVTFQFTCEFWPEINSAVWTPGDVEVGEANIGPVKKVPSLSHWGLIALLVLLIGATAYVTKRRRSAPTV